MITYNQFISTINNVVPFACSGRIVSRYLRNACAFIYYYSYPCPRDWQRRIAISIFSFHCTGIVEIDCLQPEQHSSNYAFPYSRLFVQEEAAHDEKKSGCIRNSFQRSVGCSHRNCHVSFLYLLNTISRDTLDLQTFLFQ